ncbi:hypothetical protein QC762_0009400 [Podospora pseudocomata]|uniref:Uncharacterized protein n=1 Tax=Podospora pseudocomata TaxID=2093779 RepID=A0ABR0GUR3_9PEZI|nr:hypothetical protein QC762_0009400 [Podospora pseudocomata]
MTYTDCLFQGLSRTHRSWQSSAKFTGVLFPTPPSISRYYPNRGGVGYRTRRSLARNNLPYSPQPAATIGRKHPPLI